MPCLNTVIIHYLMTPTDYLERVALDLYSKGS